VGDLAWWLFYLNQDYALAEHLFLWEEFLWEEPATGALAGWALLSPNYSAFDVFVRPDQWHNGAAQAMLLWAETRMASLVRTSGGDHLAAYWVAEQDARLRDHLAGRGFRQGEFVMVHTEQSLAAPLPAPALPAGFSLRGTRSADEAGLRAAASHAAFASSLPLEVYTRRYRNFMESPVYTPELDVVAEAPDGRIAAFCVAWTDEVNRVGQLEPVGVHPAFQRQGLGRAVVQEALGRLQARGMARACVGFKEDNAAARALYLGAGFEVQYRILSYIKVLENR
jgi:ribosomal protein S18 acetylase RimI-like enzyme